MFPTTTLTDHPLEVVHQIKYLGVTFSHNLCWSPQVQSICKKARRILSILYRQFSSTDTHCSTVLKLYITLVRPHLEYAAQVWNPHLAKDILSLERVQQFGLRICSRNYHANYEYLLDFSKFHLLKIGEFSCLCVLFIIESVDYK